MCECEQGLLKRGCGKKNFREKFRSKKNSRVKISREKKKIRASKISTRKNFARKNIYKKNFARKIFPRKNSRKKKFGARKNFSRGKKIILEKNRCEIRNPRGKLGWGGWGWYLTPSLGRGVHDPLPRALGRG